MSHYQPEFFDSHDKADYVQATGGWGCLYCDPVTGNVVHYDRGGEWQKPGDGYDSIVRLDVDEWRETYPVDDIKAGHDILDFGSWDNTGLYVEAESDWRFNLWADRPQIKLGEQAAKAFAEWKKEQAGE